MSSPRRQRRVSMRARRASELIGLAETASAIQATFGAPTSSSAGRGVGRRGTVPPGERFFPRSIVTLTPDAGLGSAGGGMRAVPGGAPIGWAWVPSDTEGYVCARPVDATIPCTAADLRRETAETRMVVNQVSEMTRALRIKDHMIWDLTQRLKAYGGVDSATHEDFTREISEATKRCSSATNELEAMRSQLAELKRENAELNREHDASRRHTAMLTEQLARMQEATAALRSATEQIASQERG